MQWALQKQVNWSRLTHVGPRNNVADGVKYWTNPFASARGDKSAMWSFAKILETCKIAHCSVSSDNATQTTLGLGLGLTVITPHRSLPWLTIKPLSSDTGQLVNVRVRDNSDNTTQTSAMTDHQATVIGHWTTGQHPATACYSNWSFRLSVVHKQQHRPQPHQGFEYASAITKQSTTECD